MILCSTRHFERNHHNLNNFNFSCRIKVKYLRGHVLYPLGLDPGPTFNWAIEIQPMASILIHLLLQEQVNGKFCARVTGWKKERYYGQVKNLIQRTKL